MPDDSTQGTTSSANETEQPSAETTPERTPKSAEADAAPAPEPDASDEPSPEPTSEEAPEAQPEAATAAEAEPIADTAGEGGAEASPAAGEEGGEPAAVPAQAAPASEPAPEPEPSPKKPARQRDRGEETTEEAEKRVAEEAAAARVDAAAQTSGESEEAQAPPSQPTEATGAEETSAPADGEPADQAAGAGEEAPGEEEEASAEERAASDGEQTGEAEAETPELPDDPVSLKLLAALDSGEPVEGKVFGWNQGGYHVLIDGLLAFCPRSEIELGNPKSPKKYIEKTYPFRVIEHRPEGNRFIVSRSKIMEEQQAERRAAVKERLSQGAELEGRVTSLTGFGAFVDLGGGIEGMVHVSELSHRSVDHPKELVKKGQKVKVKVLKIEKGGDRISLSMKALEKNPWAEFADKHPRGSEFAGKITGKTDFGVFVEVEPGMEGLVHVSALPPGQGLESEELEEGKEISGWVKETEVKRQRISLSLRPVPTSDPWKDVRDKYPEGDVVSGTVEEIAPFGVFINLEPGLTGLLPNSEMNLPRGTHPGRVYSPGTEVKVQVGKIEPKRKRMTLVPEGSKIEGSRTDYKEYRKKSSASGGMPTLAAAFEKLKKEDD